MTASQSPARASRATRTPSNTSRSASPQRGEYLKATRDIRDILSGTVAPRPDPAPPPAVSYDDCVKSMNQAQAVADEAAIERDLLQPGSEQYFMDLHKFNRLRAEVAVNAGAGVHATRRRDR